MPQISKQLPGQPTKVNNQKLGPVSSRLVSAWDICKTLKMLLYGKSATGKTTLWSTWPKPILALITSGGEKPGELRSIDTPELRKVITPLVVSQSTEIFDLLKEAGDFQTVVLDHASGLQDLVLKELLKVDQLPAQKGWGLASQQTWGQCTQQCKEILRALLSIQQNVVIVAQERVFNSGDEGSASDVITPTVGAGLTPSLTGWLNPACDFVVQTFIRQKEVTTTTTMAGKTIETIEIDPRETEYCLRTAPSPVFMTKFRMPRGKKLPLCIVDPSYAKVMDLIEGK